MGNCTCQVCAMARGDDVWDAETVCCDPNVVWTRAVYHRASPSPRHAPTPRPPLSMEDQAIHRAISQSRTNEPHGNRMGRAQWVADAPE